MGLNRPDPVRWMWYAAGGRLPERHREWVLHDVTAPNWRWRYAVHVVLRTLPFAVVGFVLLTLLPGMSPVLALVAVGVGLLFALYLTVTSAEEFREVRLVQHGYPPGTARRVEKTHESKGTNR
jgi:hypothetical protein